MKSTQNPENTNLNKLSGLRKSKFPKMARTSRLKFKDMNHTKIYLRVKYFAQIHWNTPAIQLLPTQD